MDRLQAMETFVRVVESGSFSAAARDLRIGQPAVSKIVAALEDQLRVRLLVRSTRRLTPTEAGQIFYERARVVLADAQDAWVSAKGAGAALEGRLRVCAPVTFARLHIVPKLGAFLEAHPKLRVELVMDDRSIDLLEENIDVALRLGALSGASLTARKIASTDRLVVASPSYIDTRGRPEKPSDLLRHEAIIYAQAVGGEEWRFRQGTSETSVRVPSRLSCTAAEGVREAVLAGMGVAIVSRWMMRKEIESGAVVPLLDEWRLPSVELWAAFPSGRMSTAKARAFATWFETALR